MKRLLYCVNCVAQKKGYIHACIHLCAQNKDYGVAYAHYQGLALRYTNCLQTETLNMDTLTKCRSLTSTIKSALSEESNTQQSKANNRDIDIIPPWLAPVHSSQRDWRHLHTHTHTHTPLSQSLLSATSHSVSLKAKQYFVHTWCMQICTYCKTSNMLQI